METIELATQINPKATKVVAITDDSISGQGSTQQFFDCSESFPDLELSTINCSELTCKEIGRKVASYGNDTILIFLMMTTDVDDNKYSNIEAVEYLSGYAKIPVYKADELGMGSGILGGVVVSYEDMTSKAAEIILAMDAGQDISEFPVCNAETLAVQIELAKQRA